MAALYRVQQFVRAAGAWLRPRGIKEDLIRNYLPPQAVDLFRAMPRYDRQHALNVARALREQEHDDPDLLAAALLHDAGKSTLAGKSVPAGQSASGKARVRLWHRVAVVLIHATSPGLLARIGRDEPGSWRRPFYVQQHHAAIGAEMARQAGCSQITAGLIRRHEDPPGEVGDPLLAALQAADNRN